VGAVLAAPRQPEPWIMKSFLRENWIFIVAPLVLVLVGLVVLIAFSDDAPSNFIYNIF
jgi:hypothetical protein